jgi:hypothetical protein
MKVKIQNPDLSGEERTYLTSAYSSGTTLTVRNNDGFTDNWFVVVGEPGQEQTESRRIASTTGNTTITISSALRFSHSKSCPVYLCQWDEWSFENKPTGGSFSEIDDSPVDIGWDNYDLTTIIVVSGGLTTDTYRWRPYNSYLTTYGTYSDELAGTGLTRYQVGYLIQQVQKNPLAKEVSDENIIDYFNDYQALVYEEMPKAWWFTKEGTALATTASTYKYAISSNWTDFLSMKFMLYRYVSGDNDMTYPLTWSPTLEFYNLKSDANQSTDDSVKYWTILPPDDDSAKGYIGLHPTPKTDDCYLKPVYYFELTDLDSFGDTIVVPHPKGYIDYALYRICDDIKSNQADADKYERRVRGSIIALKRRGKRQLGQPEFFRFRGARGWSRLFGEGGITSSSESREDYW